MMLYWLDQEVGRTHVGSPVSYYTIDRNTWRCGFMKMLTTGRSIAYLVF